MCDEVVREGLRERNGKVSPLKLALTFTWRGEHWPLALTSIRFSAWYGKPLGFGNPTQK